MPDIFFQWALIAVNIYTRDLYIVCKDMLEMSLERNST